MYTARKTGSGHLRTRREKERRRRRPHRRHEFLTFPYTHTHTYTHGVYAHYDTNLSSIVVYEPLLTRKPQFTPRRGGRHQHHHHQAPPHAFASIFYTHAQTLTHTAHT